MRYSRVCGSYHDNHDRGLLLTRKLLNQGFLVVKLKSSLRKFYGHHNDLVNRQGISVSQMTTYFLRLNHKPVLFSFMTHHRVCNTTGATRQVQHAQQELYHLSVAPEFTPVISGVHVARFFIFCILFCRSLQFVCPFHKLYRYFNT